MQVKSMQMKVLAQHPLTKKLSIVIAVKFAVLAALWWAFFSGQGGHVTPEQAADAILHPRNFNATQY